MNLLIKKHVVIGIPVYGTQISRGAIESLGLIFIILTAAKAHRLHYLVNPTLEKLSKLKEM